MYADYCTADKSLSLFILKYDFILNRLCGLRRLLPTFYRKSKIPLIWSKAQTNYLVVQESESVFWFQILGSFHGLDSFHPNTVFGKTGWLSGLAPPSTQGLILETQDQVPHVRLPAWSLLLPLPVSLPLSVCLSWINEIFEKTKHFC